MRSVTLDWAFYDVGNLSDAEFGRLAKDNTLEGAILVVEPNPDREGEKVTRHADFRRFRSAPGDLLKHFAIAGVGSSDVGAASLARTLANHLGEPVGAIVSGYGVSDLATEAAGGWFFFGGLNRARAAGRLNTTAEAARSLVDHIRAEDSPATARGWETATLLRLLTEPERDVQTVIGHSKGCLAISFVLQLLALGDEAAFERLKDARIVTAGAVAPMPEGLTNVKQFLGALDWFGGLNSDLTLPRTTAPMAWHHLNTRTRLHLDLAAALDGRFD